MLDDEVLEIFLHIINRMYEENVVPEDWNIGIVTTIYKKKVKEGTPKIIEG